ncbi:hypothetical protein RKE29_21330 [Streptomyces sp. B1866]|uniref:3-hydroxyacyl-ACP dehydratase FabZ family protein n=1 Tax=Streptomyces sp. B1866 TaxID=3075431 RepID=UPI0028902B0A|nr:hypothetical protein [Streptomyces sp. B1866]MDT3399157.1 hypothetical protein [Streptomyces sp. B1866]
MPPACTPVDGTVEVVWSGTPDEPARTVVRIDEAEQVFAGHYPGFPIFPGVCVVEYVHHSALATLPDPAGRWRLAAIESSRFTSPVYPGDVLTTELTWSRDGEAWRCRAVAATERGQAAQVRLRFEAGRAPLVP